MSGITFDLWRRIATILETATWLDDAEVHLLKTAITPDWETPLATLTAEEADYTGYNEVVVTPPATIYADPAGNMIAQLPSVAFQPTGTAIANTIFGYWIQGTVGGVGVKLLAFSVWDEGVALNGPEDALIVDPRIILGQPTID